MDVIKRIKKWWKDINTPYEKKFYKYKFEIIMCGENREVFTYQSNKYYSFSFEDFLRYEVFDKECIKTENQIVNTQYIKKCFLLEAKEKTLYYFDDMGIAPYSLWGATEEQIEQYNNKILGGKNEKY